MVERDMEGKLKYLLLKTVQDNNILPVTSVCGMACRFCSHHNNPSGVETYRFGHLDMELVKELIDYLPPRGPVIIGESATRIIEGDPFTHPHFQAILGLVREKYPEKLIKITTHGSLLSREMVNFLKKLEPVELNISLNCATPEERVFLMGDKNPEVVFQALEEITDKGITFNGSIVALPWLMGIDNIGKTIELLINYQARTIRVLVPGFSKQAGKKLNYSFKKVYASLSTLVNQYVYQETPVLLEPPVISDLKARITGLIPGSPAANTILRTGDIINKINGKRVISRTEAFRRAEKLASPELEIIRNNQKYRFVIPKSKGEKPGFIVSSDLSYKTIQDIKNKLDSAKKIAIITSVLARKLIEAVLNEIGYSCTRVKILEVQNSFFGGSIACAGLLTVGDILKTLDSNGERYKLILVPGIIFDIFGNDLTGTPYRVLEEKLKTKVELL
jgi:hypothetical protein